MISYDFPRYFRTCTPPGESTPPGGSTPPRDPMEPPTFGFDPREADECHLHFGNPLKGKNGIIGGLFGYCSVN